MYHRCLQVEPRSRCEKALHHRPVFNLQDFIFVPKANLFEVTKAGAAWGCEPMLRVSLRRAQIRSVVWWLHKMAQNLSPYFLISLLVLSLFLSFFLSYSQAVATTHNLIEILAVLLTQAFTLTLFLTWCTYAERTQHKRKYHCNYSWTPVWLGRIP